MKRIPEIMIVSAEPVFKNLVSLSELKKHNSLNRYAVRKISNYGLF